MLFLIWSVSSGSPWKKRVLSSVFSPPSPSLSETDRERERERERRGRERGRQRNPNRLSTVSAETYSGLKLTNGENMT